jgi:hypothetical protein
MKAVMLRSWQRIGALVLGGALIGPADVAGTRVENYVTQVAPGDDGAMPKNGVVFVEVGYFDDPSIYVPTSTGGASWSYELVHRVLVARPPEVQPGSLTYLLTTRQGWPPETRTVTVNEAEDTQAPEVPSAPLVEFYTVDNRSARFSVYTDRPQDGVMAVVEQGDLVVGAWLPPAELRADQPTGAAFGIVPQGDGPQCVTVRWVDAAGLSSARSAEGCAEQGCTCVSPRRARSATDLDLALVLLIAGGAIARARTA